MSAPVHIGTCFAGLVIGCVLVLGFAGGQDIGGGGKGKKEKGPKGDKWDKGDKGNPEDKAIYKTAEKAAKGGESERDKWVKELNKAFPGRVSPGLTQADFEQWFGLLGVGGANWRREDAPIKQIAELFDRAAGRLNLGEVASLRRDEFLRYAERFLAPGFSPQWKPADPFAEADKVFRQLDRDGSGFLEPNEWPDRLRAMVDQFDRDRDGRISPDEYRAYFEGRVVTVIQAGPEPPQRPQPSPSPSVPPTAERFTGPVRYGHLPPGLPAWFVDLDTDQDGQIALYEWRKAVLPMAEFMEMDLNADGLLPPDEYLRYLRVLRTRRPEPDPEP